MLTLRLTVIGINNLDIKFRQTGYYIGCLIVEQGKLFYKMNLGHVNFIYWGLRLIELYRVKSTLHPEK